MEHAFQRQIIQGVCDFGLQGIHLPWEENDDSRLLSESFCSATLWGSSSIGSVSADQLHIVLCNGGES